MLDKEGDNKGIIVIFPDKIGRSLDSSYYRWGGSSHKTNKSSHKNIIYNEEVYYDLIIYLIIYIPLIFLQTYSFLFNMIFLLDTWWWLMSHDLILLSYAIYG